MNWGCKREGQAGQIVNPIQSARLRSSRGFNFRYGKVEVEAKLPAGDWLWPGEYSFLLFGRVLFSLCWILKAPYIKLFIHSIILAMPSNLH